MAAAVLELAPASRLVPTAAGIVAARGVSFSVCVFRVWGRDKSEVLSKLI